MKKKSVRFDEREGGAIQTPIAFESGQPTAVFSNIRRDDFTTVVDDEYYSIQNASNRFDHYYDALNQNPRNMFPMFQYLPSSEGKNPAYTKDLLLKGLSGFGSHKDPPHIQKAVVHSLKAFPHLLRMYLNSA